LPIVHLSPLFRDHKRVSARLHLTGWQFLCCGNPCNVP
jgi:hypothetical protein